MQRTRFAPGEWDLDDVIPDDEVSLGKLLADLEGRTKRFEKIRERLPSFGQTDIGRALEDYEGLVADVARIATRAFMKYSANTSDQDAKAALDKAEELEADQRNRTLFFRLWWTSLSSGKANSLAPRNPDFSYVLKTWRDLKPFTLDEKVEQAVALKNTTGFLGWSHHYDRLTSGYTFTLRVRGKVLRDVSGKPKVMVIDQVSRLFGSPDPAVREAAYRALLGRFADNGGILGEVYRTVVRDWRNENVKLRGYATPIASRNLENDVADEAVDTLLEVCKKNATVFQEFFQTKARLLGMRKMNRFHLLAPLETKERNIGYADAVREVIDAYFEFDRKTGELASRVFESGHVDSSPRKGKRNGAYCMSIVPSVVPYVFLNFAGMTRDVYTIAHETGHAVHSQLSSTHSMLTFHPPLVLAETASVFGEMILFDKRLREEKDPEVKREVLLDKISSFYSTIGRQAHFVIFEKEAHEEVAGGATVEELCRAYLRNLKGQFGDTVDVPEQFQWEWTYIPHIYHTPFYCYAYAFGNLLSLSLYDRYQKERKAFVPDYLKVLAYGGSESPEKILKEVGFNLNSTAFWQGGFNVIRRMVDQLREL